MAGFNGFSAFGQGVGNGLAGGAASGMGMMQSLIAQALAEKKRREMFDAQQAQLRSTNAANIAQKQSEDATKRLEIEERGAEKGLRLAPIPETSEQRNARVARKGAEAFDVKSAGGELLPEQADALRATSSLGGVLGAPGRLMNPRAVGQRWERDSALAGPEKPQPWKKGAVYDIEDQAMQAVKSKFGTQALMDAITSNALLPPDQRQDMGAIMQEWRSRQSNQSTEIGKAARDMVDFHEKSGDISPDEANRLRALFTSRWGSPPDQGAPAGGATPPSSSSAPAPTAVPTSPDEHKAQLDAAAAARAQADALQAKLDGGPSMENVGAGEAEDDGDDTPAGDGGEAAALGRNMNAAFDSLRNDSPSTTSAISNVMRGPDFRQQLNNAPPPSTSAPTPEASVASPYDDAISRILQQQMMKQHPQQGGGGMPIIPPAPTLDPYIKSLGPPPPSPIQQAFQAQQGAPAQQPFIPPFRQRPGFGGAPTLPGASAAATPPAPPPSPFAGAGGRFMSALGLGGLGMPGASAASSSSSPPMVPGAAGGQIPRFDMAGPANIAPPSGAPMPSMMGPAMPQQFRTTLSQGPHFPRPNDLELVGTQSSMGMLTPDAASAYQRALGTPGMSPQDLQRLQQIVSSTRTPEQQMALRQRYLDYVAAHPDATVDEIAAATNIRMPANTPPPAPGATPPKSGHLAGSGLDLPTDLGDFARAALMQQGWRQPVAGDPEHWEYRQQW